MPGRGTPSVPWCVWMNSAGNSPARRVKWCRHRPASRNVRIMNISATVRCRASPGYHLLPSPLSLRQARPRRSGTGHRPRRRLRPSGFGKIPGSCESAFEITTIFLTSPGSCFLSRQKSFIPLIITSLQRRPGRSRLLQGLPWGGRLTALPPCPGILCYTEQCPGVLLMIQVSTLGGASGRTPGAGGLRRRGAGR